MNQFLPSLVLLVVSLPHLAAGAPPAAPAPATETIVIIRHGEKPLNDLGQLNTQGLNRALALPEVLVKKFGKADFIFAPLPHEKTGISSFGYSYIRPLMTIEPTAIRLELPVDARFPFDDLDGLEDELQSDRYRNAVVFIAWEHIVAGQIAKDLLKAFKADPTVVPPWQADDFDSVYVIKIRAVNGKRTATFSLDHEGLNGQSKKFPVPAKN